MRAFLKEGPFLAKETLIAFALLFLSYGLLVPLISGYFLVNHFFYLSPKNALIINLLSVNLFFILLISYCLLIKKKISFFFETKSFLKEVFQAFKYCLFLYPFIILTNHFLSFILEYFILFKPVAQVAVSQLKTSLNHPLLLSLTILVVTLIGPLIEEILFRGFLQTFLKEVFSQKLAIFFTALLFAFFHFSLKQGYSNFNIIMTLFILAYFLGILREQSQNILASYYLHLLFNGLNIVFIVFQG